MRYRWPMSPWGEGFRLPSVLALFASRSPPRADGFAGFAKRGVVVEETSSSDGAYVLSLRRKGWGRARVSVPSSRTLDVARMVQHDTRLSSAEHEEAARVRSHLVLELIEGVGDPLADRKALLRFADAVLGDDDPGVVDMVAQRFWSMEALDDELGHDARLDVLSLMTAHGVQDDRGEVIWLHSHGLEELGRFDFDVVRPALHVVRDPTGLQRALAFAILEGRLALPGTAVELVEDGRVCAWPVPLFLAEARERDRVVGGEGHDGVRGVLVDPHWETGLPTADPSTLLSDPDVQDDVVLYSHQASALIAERARATWDLLGEIVDELEGHVEAPLVKVAYRVAGHVEHLWFTVPDIGAAPLRGRLENEPHHVTSLRQGQMVELAPEDVTEWALPSRRGMITPADLAPLRRLRAVVG